MSPYNCLAAIQHVRVEPLGLFIGIYHKVRNGSDVFSIGNELPRQGMAECVADCRLGQPGFPNRSPHVFLHGRFADLFPLLLIGVRIPLLDP